MHDGHGERTGAGRKIAAKTSRTNHRGSVLLVMSVYHDVISKIVRSQRKPTVDSRPDRALLVHAHRRRDLTLFVGGMGLFRQGRSRQQDQGDPDEVR